MGEDGQIDYTGMTCLPRCSLEATPDEELADAADSAAGGLPSAAGGTPRPLGEATGEEMSEGELPPQSAGAGDDTLGEGGEAFSTTPSKNDVFPLNSKLNQVPEGRSRRNPSPSSFITDTPMGSSTASSPPPTSPLRRVQPRRAAKERP